MGAHLYKRLMISMAVLALLLTGCSSQVTYVDEAGNRLAVDDAGAPIVAPRPAIPSVVTRDPWPPAMAPTRPSAYRGNPSVMPSVMDPAQPSSPPWGVVDNSAQAPQTLRVPRGRVETTAPLRSPSVTAAPSDLPAPDPSWRVAPKGDAASPASSELPKRKRAGSTSKDVTSSAGLDLPPGG